MEKQTITKVTLNDQEKYNVHEMYHIINQYCNLFDFCDECPLQKVKEKTDMSCKNLVAHIENILTK